MVLRFCLAGTQGGEKDQAGSRSMQAHLSVVDEAAFAAFVQLIIYVIGSRQRWRRFMFLVFLVLAVIAGRWLLANRGGPRPPAPPRPGGYYPLPPSEPLDFYR